MWERVEGGQAKRSCRNWDEKQQGVEEEAGDRRVQRGLKGLPKSISVHKDPYLSLFCRYKKIKNISPWALLRFCGGFCLFVLSCLFCFCLGFFQSKHP